MNRDVLMAGPHSRYALLALDRAEASGAAPGAERPREPAATIGMRGVGDAIRRRASLRRAAALLAIAGLAFVGNAFYLHAKARLGQHLLERAWNATRNTVGDVKPWPWADLHPVARLSAPRQRVTVLVLSGAHGRALAWGPGHVAHSPAPGGAGTAVITGHRDTHFAFLRTLRDGDPIDIETADGARRRYTVTATNVVDKAELRIASRGDASALALVTCYPFDGVDPGTPLRFVVSALAAD
jgi:sortase A